MRNWRKKNPVQAQFARVRAGAKDRGIEFTITFSEFIAFCAETLYCNLTGNFAESATIDRIDNAKGYVAGNIQLLTRSKNAEKRMRYDQVRMQQGLDWRRAKRK